MANRAARQERRRRRNFFGKSNSIHLNNSSIFLFYFCIFRITLFFISHRPCSTAVPVEFFGALQKGVDQCLSCICALSAIANYQTQEQKLSGFQEHHRISEDDVLSQKRQEEQDIFNLFRRFLKLPISVAFLLSGIRERYVSRGRKKELSKREGRG